MSEIISPRARVEGGGGVFETVVSRLGEDENEKVKKRDREREKKN